MQRMTHRITKDLQRVKFENYDSCSSCDRPFIEGDRSHLGFIDGNKASYLCDNCSGKLVETAFRYSYTPKPFEIPQKGDLLWRYMDFTKFVSLLYTKSLYFPRADKLNDPFEGAKGLKANKQKWDDHFLQFFRQAIRNPPGTISKKTDQDVEKEAKRLLGDLESSGEFMLKHTFISCWHENESESEAMWKLYSSFMDNAVAIKTTYQNLYEALGSQTSINVGRVRYIDFGQGYAGPNEAFWRKRKSLEHEKEVRAVVYDFENSGEGLSVPCDINKLVNEIVTSPSAPEWFFSLVMDVCQKYGLIASISKSKLAEAPFY